MKLPYTIAAAVLATIFMIVKLAAPTIPLPEDVFINLGLWLLLQLGVEVVGFPLAFRYYSWKQERLAALQKKDYHFLPLEAEESKPARKKSKK